MLKHLLQIFFLWLLIASCNSNDKANLLVERKNLDSIYDQNIHSKFYAQQQYAAYQALDSLYKNEKRHTLASSIKYYYVKTWMNNYFGYYDRTIATGDSLIEIIEKNKLQDQLPDDYNLALMESGFAYFSLNNFDKAYERYFKAQVAASNKNDNCINGYIVANIGLVSYKQELYEDAIKYFQKELNFLNNCSYDSAYRGGIMKQECLDNIGLCYTKINRIDSAIKYYSLALQQIERDLNKKEASKAYAQKKGVVLGNWAKVYVKTNKLDSAEVLYREAIALNQRLGGDRKDAQLCQVQLATILLNNKKVNDGKKILDELKQELDSIDNPVAKLGWLEQKANYYKLTKNSAFESSYLKAFVAMKDSMNAAKKGASEISITKELKDKQQQLQITVLQKDNQLSKLYLIIVLVACIMLISIAVLIYRNFRKTKLLNAKVNQQKTELEKANKDKDRILNVVAHDLRNPIGAITNFLDIVQVKYEHSNEEQDILKTSHQAAIHSLTLINDLLEVNQMQEGKLKLLLAATDIHQIIQQSIQQVKYKAIAKQQDIVLQTNHNPIIIHADAEKLQRVFTNLLDNAIKFSYVQKQIFVVIQFHNKQLSITVMDSGMGIPQHLVEQLFTASITVKRSGTNNEKSNGLGLSICKQIIEAHNGSISVTSKEGKGSCFVVTLNG